MDNELEKLELLSLVNSITNELVNYTGLSGAACFRAIRPSPPSEVIPD